MKKSVVKLLICIFIFPSSTFAFDEFRTFRTDELNFEANFQYFQATGNYNNGSSFSGLTSGDSFQLMNGDLGARWVLYPRIGFSIDAGIAQAQSKDTLKTRTNSSLTDVTAGIDYLWLSRKSWTLWPEFTFKYPFNRVNYTADTVLNDEGAMEATARLVARLRFSVFDTFAYAGFRYRDEGRSSVVPFGIGAEVPVSSFKLGADLDGYQTVINDSGTGNAYAREAVVSRDGSALYFDSSNPAKLDANAWLKWNRDPYQIKFGGGTTLAGANTAGGWWVFVGLEYQLQAVWKKHSSPSENQHFQEETNDGVDQSLFAPAPAPAPVAPTPDSSSMKEETSPTAVHLKQVKKLTPQQQQQNLQNDLDKTEMQIELKSKKDHSND